jgi:hypothetical protein
MAVGTHISRSILPDHLVYNLPAKDTSPSPKMFMGAVEFLIDHFTLASITLHTHLLFHFAFGLSWFFTGCKIILHPYIFSPAASI